MPSKPMGLLPVQKFATHSRVVHVRDGEAGQVLRYRPFTPVHGNEIRPYQIQWDRGAKAWCAGSDLKPEEACG